MRRMQKQVCLLALVVASFALPAAAQSQPDAMAEKIFLSGMNLMRDKYYQQAIQDFTSLLSSYPTSSYADNAYLEMGKYYYFIERSTAKALDSFEQIINKYQGRDTTADAYYYKGVIVFEGAAGEQQLQDALANFMRTVQFYPNSPIVADSLYQTGLVEWRLQHFDQAAEHFQRCAFEHPAAPIAPAAQLALGRTWFFLGKVDRALVEIQRVRDLYVDRPEAAVALRWLTLLWRLYYQPKLDSSQLFKYAALQTVKGPGAIEECSGLAFDPAQVLHFSDPKTSRLQIVGPDFRVTGGVGARKPAGVCFDRRGAFYLADGTGILSKEAFLPLSWTKPGKKESEPVEKAVDVVRTTLNDFYVLNAADDRVLHYAPDMRFDSVFAPSAEGGVESIAIDPNDRLAVLFKKDKKVNVYDRRGKLVVTIASSGPGYSLESPIRVRFDIFGHIYVLDKSYRCAFVFDRQGKVLAQALPSLARGVRECAVNDAGEIYMWDEKSSGIWVVR